MTDRELMQQALYVIEAWERGCNHSDYWRDRDNAIAALRERLAQPEQWEQFYPDMGKPDHEWLRGECIKCGQVMGQPEQECCQDTAQCLNAGVCVAKHGHQPEQSPLDRMAKNARELGLDYEPVQEHDLADRRCECCGYMTYHREHMGCIRAAKQPEQCVGCEGNPAPGNSPCAVCGKAKPEQPDELAIWKSRALQAERVIEKFMKPEQEPVAEVKLMMTGGNAGIATRIVEIDDPLRERLHPGQLLYTTPQRREWVGLTEEEIESLWEDNRWAISYARAIEAKLREKNA